MEDMPRAEPRCQKGQHVDKLWRGSGDEDRRTKPHIYANTQGPPPGPIIGLLLEHV